MVGNNVTQFCEHLHGQRLKFFSTSDECLLIGSGKAYTLSTQEANCWKHGVLYCVTYEKMIFNGKRYCSDKYKRCTRTNDTIVEIVDGKVGIISNICKITNEREETEVIIFVKVVQTSNSPDISTDDVTITHIRQCHPDVDVTLRPYMPKCIVGPCILMQVDNTYYVSNIPRGCLGD